MNGLWHTLKIPGIYSYNRDQHITVVKKRSHRSHCLNNKCLQAGEFNVDHLQLDNKKKTCDKCNLVH